MYVIIVQATLLMWHNEDLSILRVRLGDFSLVSTRDEIFKKIDGICSDGQRRLKLPCKVCIISDNCDEISSRLIASRQKWTNKWTTITKTCGLDNSVKMIEVIFL